MKDEELLSRRDILRVADSLVDSVIDGDISEENISNIIEALDCSDDDKDSILNCVASQLDQLIGADEMADAAAEDNPYSIDKVDAMADAAAEDNPYSIDKVDAMADAAAEDNPYSIDKVDAMADAAAASKPVTLSKESITFGHDKDEPHDEDNIENDSFNSIVDILSQLR